MASSPTLELIREAELLKRHYPQGSTTLNRGILRWTGELQPSEVSRQYLVDLRYSARFPPKIFVRRPKLLVDADGHLPHIYQDGSLCLFEPGEWHPGDSIAETILPWTCEWLIHYEFWRATGEWCGSGGNHTGRVDVRPKTHRPGRKRRGRTHVNRHNQRILTTPGRKTEDN